ncbi:MAG TPA: ROK family protein [Candidatus Saccharimonadales bacterium]|nr:ROK family protein [Candidatus Saccharimonadales bacterium]
MDRLTKAHAPGVLLAVDVGGSKTLVALVDPQPGGWTWLGAPLHFATPRDPTAVVELVGQAAEQRAREAGRSIRGAGVAIPGPLDPDGGVVTHLPNLGWHGVPLAGMLTTRLNVPVALNDDARMGALGEWAVGAGRGTNILVFVTVSTGIGSGLVIDGHPYAGAHGFAGEFGHIVVDPKGPRCGCGNRGCIEAYAGGLALSRAACRAWPRRRLEDGSPAPRTASEVFRLARQRHPVAALLVNQATDALALGIGAIAAVIDPGLIVIGGSVAMGERRWLASVVARARRRCIADVGREISVVPPALGVLSSLAGAAQLAIGTSGVGTTVHVAV